MPIDALARRSANNIKISQMSSPDKPEVGQLPTVGPDGRFSWVDFPTGNIKVSNGVDFVEEAKSLILSGATMTLDPKTGDIIITLPTGSGGGVVHPNEGVLDGLSEIANQLYYKSAPVSKGDMMKNIYDKNGDGVVDIAATLSGLIASIAELNYTKGLTGNIEERLNALGNIGNFSGSSVDYASIATGYTSPKDKDMVIVIHDENNGGVSAIYVYSATKVGWQFAGVLDSPVRDFNTNPLNINTETQGIISESKIPATIARTTQVHTHINTDVLQNLADNGSGGLMYKGSPVGGGTGGGSAVPTLRGIDATATIGANQTVYLPLSTTFNKYDIRTLRAKNIYSSTNLVVEIYDKAVNGELIYKSNSSSNIYDIINIPCEDLDATQLLHAFVTNLGLSEVEVGLNVKVTNLL